MMQIAQDLKPLPEYDSASLWPNTKVLSSSQIIAYLKDPKEFYITYKNGVTKTSQPMQIGRIFSAAYADRGLDYASHLREAGCSAKFIKLFGEALVKFPIIKGSKPEWPMVAKINGWEIRATLDDYHPKLGLIIENKTGQSLWTKERADDSPQITIQAWALWKRSKKKANRIILNWWNTKRIYADVKSFETSRSLTQLKECEELLKLVIENIEAENFSNPII